MPDLIRHPDSVVMDPESSSGWRQRPHLLSAVSLDQEGACDY